MKKFKKIASISLVILFIAALMTSCKSRDKCPGVGHISTEVSTIA